MKKKWISRKKSGRALVSPSPDAGFPPLPTRPDVSAAPIPIPSVSNNKRRRASDTGSTDDEAAVSQPVCESDERIPESPMPVSESVPAVSPALPDDVKLAAMPSAQEPQHSVEVLLTSPPPQASQHVDDTSMETAVCRKTAPRTARSASADSKPILPPPTLPIPTHSETGADVPDAVFPLMAPPSDSSRPANPSDALVDVPDLEPPTPPALESGVHQIRRRVKVPPNLHAVRKKHKHAKDDSDSVDSGQSPSAMSDVDDMDVVASSVV
ncbi:uncharacterized protein LOC126302620 [Schistocerca gregaria]|uniref:uncharacterized protein LOC126302620 n=1 Tax=Schistocerca gregaria TaxID=7010 RepID=UPI00211E67A7|nr:uncharacterized protein LOC126302620 [Schistocerca gregaria]